MACIQASKNQKETIRKVLRSSQEVMMVPTGVAEIEVNRKKSRLKGDGKMKG